MKLYNSNNIKDIQSHFPKNSGIFAIIDNKVKDYFTDMENWNFYTISASESLKTLDTVSGIYSWLMKNNADRDCFIIGAGGGVTTDITGFVASTYKRGVRFALVPTTLLSASDAAIGGKNGVNHLGVKNMVGTITQPEWIWQSTVFFKTLEKRIFKEGIAEMLKTFILYDASYYEKAVHFFSNYSHSSPTKADERKLRELIRACADMKMKVVEKDEKDKGARMFLNLGHTFAHALESYLKGKVLHGEAVAAGIYASAQLSEKAGLCSSGFPMKLKEDFLSVGLKPCLNISFQLLFPAVRQDKKISSDNISIILPVRLGKAVKRKIPMEELFEICKDFKI